MFAVNVEGDGAGAGIISYVFDLTGQKFGANGLNTLAGPDSLANFPQIGINLMPCDARNYAVEGSTFIKDQGLSFQNGTTSFLLIATTTSQIAQALHIAANSDGVIDNLPPDATVIDGVGWSDGEQWDLSTEFAPIGKFGNQTRDDYFDRP